MDKFLKVSEKALFNLLVILLVFIPLYPKFPLLNVTGTFAAVRLEDLLIALSLGWWAIYISLSGKLDSTLKDKLNQALLLFFFIGLISLFSAVFVTHSAQLHLGLLHYLRRIELMALLPLAISVVKTRKQVAICLISLSLVAVLVNVYALGQQFLHWPVVSTTNSEFAKGQIIYLTPGARPNSTFAGHYDLAVFLMMVIILISTGFFMFKNLFTKSGLALLGLLSFGVLVLTAARVSFLAALVGLITSLVLTGKRLLIFLSIVVAAIALMFPSPLRDRFVSTIVVNLEEGGQRYSASSEHQAERSKLNIPTLHVYNPSPIPKDHPDATLSSDITPGEPVDPTQLGVYRSFSIRFEVEWPRAIRAFLKNPILGSGYSSMGLATDNDLLRSLGEVGLLGTLAFVLIFYEIFKRLLSGLKSSLKFTKLLTAGILAMSLAFLLNGLFIDVFEASKVAALFWLLLGINLGLIKLKES